MTDLTTQSCQPKVDKLDQPRVDELLRQVPEWSAATDLSSIERSYGFDDFYRTMAFVNAVAWIANGEDHHPDLEVSYAKCVVRFSTHSVKGLSNNDFICAAKVDALLTADALPWDVGVQPEERDG